MDIEPFKIIFSSSLSEFKLSKDLSNSPSHFSKILIFEFLSVTTVAFKNIARLRSIILDPFCLNNTPNKGISESPGVLDFDVSSDFVLRPPITIIWPDFVETTVSISLLTVQD